jgi:hypothetical protein
MSSIARWPFLVAYWHDIARLLAIWKLSFEECACLVVAFGANCCCWLSGKWVLAGDLARSPRKF